MSFVKKAPLVGLVWLLTGGLAGLAQSEQVLQPFIPIEGHIEAGVSQRWTFMGWEGAMWSFVVEAADSGLDPVLSIQNQAGMELIGNDDYDYPKSQDALLEGITLPGSETYTVTVSGFGDSAGDFTLTMLPGFSHIAADENFNGSNIWRRLSDALDLAISDGQMNLALDGINEAAAAINPDSPTLRDFYAQVHVTAVTSANAWRVGLALRQQDDATYYQLEINQGGFWRLTAHSADGVRTVQDWSTHPAIMPGKSDFTLGVLANDRMFEVFFDGQYIGQAVDTIPAVAGQIGLTVGTGNAFGSQTRAFFDDLVVTVPRLVDGEAVWPQRLVHDNAPVIFQELQRHQLIPVASELVLNVPESFAQGIAPGVQRFGLGRGETYENFAVLTSVTWQIIGDGLSGCGLALRNIDDSFYTLAYVDKNGGYGLAQREGDQFLPGVFGEVGEWPAGARQLLVVANGDILHFYVDGLYRGSVTSDAIAGGISNAVINFDPLDTTCQFNNTWLWRWD